MSITYFVWLHENCWNLERREPIRRKIIAWIIPNPFMVVLVIFRFQKCITTLCLQCNTKKINSSVPSFCFPFYLNCRVLVDFNPKEESCFDFLSQLLLGKKCMVAILLRISETKRNFGCQTDMRVGVNVFRRYDLGVWEFLGLCLGQGFFTMVEIKGQAIGWYTQWVWVWALMLLSDPQSPWNPSLSRIQIIGGKRVLESDILWQEPSGFLHFI